MTDQESTGERDEAKRIHERVRVVFGEIGVPQEVMDRSLISVDDIRDLIAAGPAPGKILQAGGGLGITTLVLALTFPRASIIRIDPDLPVGFGLPGAEQRSAGEIARLAAERAGVADRIRFVSGGFSETLTSRSVIDTDLRSDRTQIRMAGPEICAKEQPFDLAYVDGLSSAETRVSDIRLAASALATDGTIVSGHSLGAKGATVRAGVFEFLRYYPDYTFLHARHTATDSSLGILKKRAAGWAGGYSPAGSGQAEETPMEVRERLADLVATTFGKRPILELCSTSPMLGAAFRVKGVASRTLRLTGTDWTTHFFDPVIDQICNALDHTPDSVLFSADLMNYAPDEFLGRLFARLEDRRTPSLFLATPPGEIDVAGPRSRPAARIIDLAASQNLKTFLPASLEFERARHEGAGRPGRLGSSSQHASLLLFARADGQRDARGRSILETTPHAASVREQIELQRIWSEASLQQSLSEATTKRASAEAERDNAVLRWREASDAAQAERDASERSLLSARSELADVKSEHASLSLSHRDADERANRAEEALRAIEVRSQESDAALRAETVQLRRDVERLMRERDAAREEAADSAAAVASARESERRRVEALEADLASLRVNKERLAAELDEATQARAQADALREEVELDLGGRLHTANASLEELQQSDKRRGLEFETRLTSLETRGASPDADAELSRLRLRAEELADRLRVRDEEFDKLRADLLDLQSRERDIGKELVELRERHEREIFNRDIDLEQAREQLAAEGLQVVDATCREADAGVRLDGIGSHLDLTQIALAKFRDDPTNFEADAVRYPGEPTIASGRGERLVERATDLHGQAADVSREVALELERLGRERLEYQEWKLRQLSINESSHEEALYLARQDFAERFWTQEQLNGRVAAGIAFNNRLLADILALTPGDEEDPALLQSEVRSLELSSSSGVSMDVLLQVDAQEKRLLHLLHTLEAERAFDDAAEDFEDYEDEINIDEGESAETRADEPAEFLDSVVRRPSFQIVGDPVTQNVVRDFRSEPRKVVEFTQPKRKTAQEHDWLKGEAPFWPAIEREANARKNYRFWNRLWDRFSTYPETARLVRLQRSLRDRLVTYPVSPRVFDVDLYRAQGATTPYSEPLHHYLLEGETSGWSPLAGFDPAYYADQVGDLGNWKGSLLRHFLSRGVHDRRSPSAQLEDLANLAAEQGMEPLEYFYHWENAARGTWRNDPERLD